jgi:tripartite ATP-independent transporter DctP family solute receptor
MRSVFQAVAAGIRYRIREGAVNGNGASRWAGVVLAGVAVLLVGGCTGGAEGTTQDRSRGEAETVSEAETVIRLGHGLDPSHPVHRAMEAMGRRLDSLSGGQMAMKIYPSEQLGTERQCLELLQIGSLDMTKVSSAVMESFSPLYKTLGLPYLFRSEAHRFEVLEGPVGQRILQSSTEAWLRGIVYYDAGSRSFYTTNQPIREPSDLEGLKIRVQESPMAIRMMNLLGASPTPISFGELYTALQQGVVSGAENNPPSFHTTRHYELCQYYSLDRHTALPDVLVASTHLWDRLSEQERDWLMQAARYSAQVQKKLWDEATQKAMREVKKAGVEVVRPDLEKFQKAVQPLYEAFREEQPTVYRLAQEIKDVRVDSAGSDSVKNDPVERDSATVDSTGDAMAKAAKEGGKREGEKEGR